MAVLAVATGCTSDADLAGGDTAGSQPAEPVELTIAPQDGASEVAPDTPITVTADNGTISDVTVTGPEEADPDSVDAITGTLSEDETEWTSDWTLTPGTEFTVTATGESEAGETTEVVSSFSTLTATEGKRLELKANTPVSDTEVGVGMPVMVEFDYPVQNKAAVEAAMEVTSEKPAQGAWNWFSDKRLVFRTKEYWEPFQKVTVDMHLAGVEAADGVYGIENHRLEFTVGRSQISNIDEDNSHMTVERGGQQVKEFPVSLGRATTHEYTTTSGTHLTMSRETDFRMSNGTLGVPEDDPEYYDIEVDYGVRISWSGEYLHSMPSNNQLGEANTSHGCINMSLEGARWFYQNTLLGDPVVITGTDRILPVENGWGYWQRSWEDWVANSAVGEADDTTQPGTPGSPHGGNAA
ncbi:L,D-transpeptidase [Salinactinospora qingdaonensis]|uniref:L,D-transpeptidase n=1 Tax=Salinactinospora qingdaonensis TaxID=702744 RepID=UPI0031F0BF58